MGTAIEGVDLPRVICRYAARCHALSGDTHHVASPLGAWLLLALCGRTATGRLRDELTAILGVDTAPAATLAGRMLDEPHQAVATAVGIWTRTDFEAPGLASFLAALPVSVERGGRIPSQQQLDDWTREHTMGLIDRFPSPPDARTAFLLANALATKVRWDKPFEIAPASALGKRSAWSRTLTRVLLTPDDEDHVQLIVRSERAGDVAVHVVQSPDDLMVTSVIARQDVASRDVLAAAHDIATRMASRSQGQLSLYDLPLGTSALWTIEERHVPTPQPGARVERYMSVIPAWEAESTHSLVGRDLGFQTAAKVLAQLGGPPLDAIDAVQSAKARYTRTGFEAAAATSWRVRLSREMTPSQRGVERHAEIRFGHPFAVVALVAAADSPWHGVPVFSAWVAQPVDAEAEPGELLDEEWDEISPEDLEPENASPRLPLMDRLRAMFGRPPKR